MPSRALVRSRSAPLVPLAAGAEPAEPRFAVERPSKTRRKEASHDLQTLGAALLEMQDERVAGLGLGETLVDAIRAHRKMRSHEARRRHLRGCRATDDPVVIVATTQLQLRIGCSQFRANASAVTKVERRATHGTHLASRNLRVIGGQEAVGRNRQLMIFDTERRVFAAEIEVGVVGEIDDGWPVGGGAIANGDIARVFVPDLSLTSQYQASVAAAAVRGTYALQSLAGYRVVLVR